jgi:hypothetical protein
VGWPNFVCLPDWVGLVRHGGAVISGWSGIVEKVRPETKNPPAMCFSGGGCLGFRSKTEVLHSVRPNRHTHAPCTTFTGRGALLCVENHVHFCKRTLCARQVVFHGSFSFRPGWSESAPHVRFGSPCDCRASRLDRRRGNGGDLQAGQQIRRAPILDLPLPFPLSREAERIAAYRYRWRGRR